MVTLSRAISAGQAQKYHREEFTNAEDNYYTEESTIHGEWQGKLGAQWGLAGRVTREQFERLTEGRHPVTGQQIVRHRVSCKYVNAKGELVNPVEHRAGWDATFSAPKSVSLTALVGGDERVRAAHRESVQIAFDAMEKYVQARMSNAPAETTGMWLAAKFEHDSARPVDGYSAPQLHTHVVIFNVTQTADGQTRSLQPMELYRSQQYATAVYRAEIAARLKLMGYKVERGKHEQPEIVGYSPEYLRAASPRRQQIEEDLCQKGFSGARAAQIAAHQTRERKQALPRKEVLQQHRRMAQMFGNQPQQVVSEAAVRPYMQIKPDQVHLAAQAAMEQSRESSMERTAVAEERALMRDALKHAMGVARLSDIQKAFGQQVAEGRLIEVQCDFGAAERTFTTPEMQMMVRDIVRWMSAGRDNHTVLVSGESRAWAEERHPNLSGLQRQAVGHVLTSRDLMTALNGVAGAGKTTTLAAVAEAAVHEGYEVRGLAPTSHAAQTLAEAGMEAETLQMHLARNERGTSGGKRLYIVDESSMVSTRQAHVLIERLSTNDRILWVGDTRQHEAVDAGRPYAQLQETGMRTAQLTEIVRQKDPSLRITVEYLAQGKVEEAIAQLNAQGRVHEVEGFDERILAITREYVQHPGETLVVAPDNQSRREINASIHGAMQDAGLVSPQGHIVRVLHQRQDMTAADRMIAHNYDHEDVLRFQKSSKTFGIKAGEHVRVEYVDAEANMLTVSRKNGTQMTYDPRRLQGVQVYRERKCEFATGDRIQITLPNHALKLTNRELGIIEQIDQDGDLKLKMDSGREVSFNIERHPHLDHGYAVTSYSSQGQTADRVLIHVDSELASGVSLNERFAYVAISRARHDAQIFTNDAASLGYELGRDISKLSALQQSQTECQVNPSEVMELMPERGIEISR